MIYILYILCLLLAYGLGSIPSAYFAGKWIKGVDLRQVGSGNLGFTNATRVLGWKLSLPVLLFDLLKGIPGILLARHLTPDYEILAVLAGMLAILGHNWTFFLRFQGGGKGIAVSAGVFLTLAPYCTLIALATFGFILATTKYMSLASISGALALPLSAYLFRSLDYPFAPTPATLIFIIIASALAIFRHRANIRRLLQGEEHKIGSHSKED